jgi:hypothetical protein
METSKTKIANSLKAIRGAVKHSLSENIVCAERLPLAKCREILNSDEQKYTDEEVLIIRDYLYQLAVIASEQLDIEEQEKDKLELEQQNEQQAKIISLNEYKNNTNEKSDYLRTG